MITPHMDKLARSGLLFERAYCQYPVCMPSRVSLLAGIRNAGGYFRSSKDRGILSMPQLFKDNGYTTALADNFKHRHASHLYPLYYGLSPEFENNPELREAARRSIDRKLLDYWERGTSMSFGLVQLGQAATTLGEGELAYRCLGHLVNRFWFNNMASTHDHKLLLNTDISGGMPSVIIKMLASSSLGKIQLLPALPKAWPTGAIDGVLCRGQVEIKRLQWDRKRVLVRFFSVKQQTVTIEMPTDIADVAVQEGLASVQPADRKNCCQLSLPAGREVTLRIELQ